MKDPSTPLRSAQEDADRFNSTTGKPVNLNFVVKLTDEKIQEKVAMPISGHIQPIIVSFTVPSFTNFEINPNLEQKFIAPEFFIVNNSFTPITVAIESFKQKIDTSHSFIDVAPYEYTIEQWAALNKKDSKSKLALAIATNKTNWLTLLRETPIYVYEVNNTIDIGTIGSKDSVSFKLIANHGNSFDSSINSDYIITWIFALES